MSNSIKTYISLYIVEVRYRVFPIGILRAIGATSWNEACEFGDGNAKDLLVKDVIDAILWVGNSMRKTDD